MVGDEEEKVHEEGEPDAGEEDGGAGRDVADFQRTHGWAFAPERDGAVGCGLKLFNLNSEAPHFVFW